MDPSVLQQFTRGGLVFGCFVTGLFFLHYFRQSRDRIFVFFVVAFWALALHWIGLAIADPPAETRHYLFLLRLLAFVALIIGILDKNRRSRAD
jgi:hypothetical protein